jgi:hypothetical protein
MNETHCDRCIRAVVHFDINEEVSHGHSNLRDAVKLPMDCFARMATYTRGIVADAILVRRLARLLSQTEIPRITLRMI